MKVKSVKEELSRLKLPKLLSREEMKNVLLDCEYGRLPEIDYSFSCTPPSIIERRYCAGAVQLSYTDMTITTAVGEHAFRIKRLLHIDGKRHPLFIFLNFSQDVPSPYYPVEELGDMGADILSFCYADVTSDDGDFSNGLARLLLPEGQKEDNTAGKIMIWGWAASRVLDYAETIPDIDSGNAAVIGHSRLGKVALVASMMDTRFRFAISNNSGTGGASLARGALGVTQSDAPRELRGETITAITDNFPYWFCKNYQRYRKTNIPYNFDQHYLLATIAPRYLCVGSASKDFWASPDSEFLSCVAASEAYEMLGLSGLVHSDTFPNDTDCLGEGSIGYHRRDGLHFLSRHDWARYIDFVVSKLF